MTFTTLRVLEDPGDLTDTALEEGRLKLIPYRNLEAHAPGCGPYALQAWARDRDVRIYFVHNCWVPMAVRGERLKAFLIERLGEPATAAATIAGNGAFLIEAEEF